MNGKTSVRDIYHKGIIFCRPDTPLQEVVRIMADSDVHAVFVAEREGEQPIGVISHTDVIRHYGRSVQEITASQVMKAPIITIPTEALAEEAAAQMLEHAVHRLLVVDAQGNAVGVLSTTDLVRDMRGTRWIWYMG